MSVSKGNGPHCERSSVFLIRVRCVFGSRRHSPSPSAFHLSFFHPSFFLHRCIPVILAFLLCGRSGLQNGPFQGGSLPCVSLPSCPIPWLPTRAYRTRIFVASSLGGPSPVNRAKQPWIKYPRARFRPSSLLVHIPQPTITSKFQSAMAIPNSTPPVWSLSTWMAIPKPINL